MLTVNASYWTALSDASSAVKFDGMLLNVDLSNPLVKNSVVTEFQARVKPMSVNKFMSHCKNKYLNSCQLNQ